MKREVAPALREKRLRKSIALFTMVGALAIPAARASEGEPKPETTEPLPEFIIGAQEDSILTENQLEAEKIAGLIANAGFNTLKVTVPWTYPRQCAEIDNDLKRFQTAVKAAKENDLTFMLNSLPGGGAGLGRAPITPSQRQCFVDTNISYMHAFEQVWPAGHLILEWPNEPNSDNFWRPQKNKEGEWIAPKDVAKLLIAGYKKAKEEAGKLDIDITIIGGGLASKHRALDFIADMGEFKRESGVKGPMMDAISLHPYAEINSEPPDRAYEDFSTIGFAGLNNFIERVDNSFIRKGLPVLLSEYGAKARIPTDKLDLYDLVPQSSNALINERTQAEYYVKAFEMAERNSRIGGLVLFNVIDDADGFWTSGIMYPDGTPKSSYQAVTEALSNTG